MLHAIVGQTCAHNILSVGIGSFEIKCVTQY